MRYFLFFVLIWIPSLAFSQIRIGVLPIEFKSSEVSPKFKEDIEKSIFKNLMIPSQIEVFSLKEIGEKESSVNYFLKSVVKISKEKAEIKLNLLEPLNSSSIYSVKENVELSQLSSRLIIHCEEIKKILLTSETSLNLPGTEKKSFMSKINPFSKLNNLFSELFSKKKEFDIKIPIPPPSPPPGYSTEYSIRLFSPQYPSKEPFKSVSQGNTYEKKSYTTSPWQWF